MWEASVEEVGLKMCVCLDILDEVTQEHQDNFIHLTLGESPLKMESSQK